jgi:hypothetical protein
MDVTADELAGVVDLFGALTREELQAAAAELAFKADGDFEPDAFADDVDDALHTYHLLAVENDAVEGTDAGEGPWLVAGPIAFPELPEGAADLPHIMDLAERSVDRAAAGQAAESRFRADAATAVESGDADRIAELLDVSYELEAWAPVDLAAARERLDAAAD